MTAPTPSPEEFSCSVWECMEAGNSNAAGDLVRSRDASLTAPLREEVERLTRERDEAVKRIACLQGAVTRGFAHATEPFLTASERSRAAVLDRADRAEAENARLRAALQPFADVASLIPENAMDDWLCPLGVIRDPKHASTVSDFRAAAKALAPEGGK